MADLTLKEDNLLDAITSVLVDVVDWFVGGSDFALSLSERSTARLAQETMRELEPAVALGGVLDLLALAEQLGVE